MRSLDRSKPPPQLSFDLLALWHDYHGDWQAAHEIVQNEDSPGSHRIHAYLHRKEGDEWNARYWHRRAGSSFPENISLEQEWQELVQQYTE